MSVITKIEVETWTRNESNAGTGDQIDCIITFMDNRFFQHQLDTPINDFEQGQHDRFNLNLTTAAAMAAISGQQHTDIKSVTIKKVDGSNTWKCGAVGLRVNDVVLLSRYVTVDLASAGTQFTTVLRKNGVLDGLEVKITTGSWGGSAYPSTNDQVKFGLRFANGLNQITDLHLNSTGDDFQAGATYSYLIPLPGDPFTQLPADVLDFSLKLVGIDGWLLQAAWLFANGNTTPIMGNGGINQFLDNKAAVLGIQEWSSKDVRGPVLGYISDTSANVQFRVEREGTYRLRLYAHGSGTALQTIEKELAPTGVFTFAGLTANTHYDIRLFLVHNSQEAAVANADSAFRTSPPEGSGVEFSFGIGSCCRNRDNTTQSVWTQIKNIAFDPAVDIVNSAPVNNLRFFIHTGDTHYFYDDILGNDVLNTPFLFNTACSAHLSSRLNANFLDMAKRVPTCALWDDHDYRFDNADSSGVPVFLKDILRDAFLQYWANPTPFSYNPGLYPPPTYGLTTRMSYGNVDIYLMDGRYERVKSSGKFFGTNQIDLILQDLQSRGTEKLRIFVSGSLWNHTEQDDDQTYGHSSYGTEREYFYSALNNLITQNKTKGIIFISGDVHQNEIFEVKLAPSGTINYAPEFVCSPLGNNGGLQPSKSNTGERKWNKSSQVPDGSYWGYAQITINTKDPANITLRVQFRRYDNNSVYKDKIYTLVNNQFIY